MVTDQVLLSASSDPLLPASYVCARDLDGSQVTKHAQARQRHVASHWRSGQASSADVVLSAQAAWLLASQALWSHIAAQMCRQRSRSLPLSSRWPSPGSA